VRLAHVSDVHATAPRCAWRLRDWFSKRLTSWANLRLLGRARHFAHTERVLSALRADLDQRPLDKVVFSGDATALGFGEEVARAADLLGVGQRPGLAVPGNHDYCTPAAQRSGHFERCFAPWLAGERVDEAHYPFAQRVGSVWLVAVNSALGRRWPTDASGAVGADQRRRLALLLQRLDGGPRILVTHYPVRAANGLPERPSHALRDLDELIAVAVAGKVGLWLHGHCHDFYHHGPSERVPFPVICAGSTTQTGLWAYGDYTIVGNRLEGAQRAYDPLAGRFCEVRKFELTLAGG
jgi:3',5'-cyclic AMP phosphodiesterase CpdA